MKGLLIKGVVLTMGVVAGSAYAACPEPAAVTDVPKGATATRDDMMAAQRAIKAYDTAVKAYTECLQQSGENPAKGNDAIDKLTKIAQQFNNELRTFKEKNGAG
jgi:hypothetical protein